MSPLGRPGRSGKARARLLPWTGPLRIRARGETAGPVGTPLPFVDRAGAAGSSRPGHENVELVPGGPGPGNRGPLPGEAASRQVRNVGMRGMEAFGTSAGPRRGQGRSTGPGGDGVREGSSSGTDPAPGRSPATPMARARGQENVSRRKDTRWGNRRDGRGYGRQGWCGIGIAARPPRGKTFSAPGGDRPPTSAQALN